MNSMSVWMAATAIDMSGSSAMHFWKNETASERSSYWIQSLRWSCQHRVRQNIHLRSPCWKFVFFMMSRWPPKPFHPRLPRRKTEGRKEERKEGRKEKRKEGRKEGRGRKADRQTEKNVERCPPASSYLTYYNLCVYKIPSLLIILTNLIRTALLMTWYLIAKKNNNDYCSLWVLVTNNVTFHNALHY